MGSKVIRNVTKILKATSGRLFGRVTSGTGRAEELTPADVRTLLSVSTSAEIASAYQPLDSDLTAIASLTTTSHGRSLLTDADPSASRTTLGLGSLATQSGTFSGTSSGTNTGDQNLFSTISVSGQSDVVADATSDTLTLVAGTNISITTNAGSDSITITSTASGLSGTGSVDNAVLRADGTGGATLQASAWLIADNATASPNNTVNHASIQATGGTTNVSVSIVPKGTGAFCLAVPDGTATGGNVRGANSVDLQTSRSAAADVASGTASFLAGAFGKASGDYSTCFSYGLASGTGSFAVGKYASNLSTASGSYSFAGGGATASSDATFAFGYQSIASGIYSSIALGVQNTASGSDGSIALGNRSAAHRGTMFAYASGYFGSSNGDSQFVLQVMRVKTTNATPTTMQTGHEDRIGRLTIPSGKIMFCNVLVSGIKSDGSAAACYKRKLAIKNVGGTTSLVGSVETIGTDIEDSAACDVAITADNVNDCLQINVTGIAAETWRWVAVVEGLEIAYGT